MIPSLNKLILSSEFTIYYPNMFTIRASSRNAVSRSIFSTTFVVAFSLVVANSVVPCPVDRSVANESNNAAKDAREKLQLEKGKQHDLTTKKPVA